MKKEQSTLEKIDYVIMKLIEEHKNWNAQDLISSLVFDPNAKTYITTDDELVQAMIPTITRDEIIKEIAAQSLRVSQIDIRAGFLPEKYNCIRFYEYLLGEKVKGEQITNFLKSNDWILEMLISAFSKTRYSYRETIDIKKLDEFSNLKIRGYLNSLSDKRKALEAGKIKRLKIVNKTLNKCRDDILSGVQLKKDATNYSLGTDMFASSSIGNFKNTQEDSVLLLRHPKNPNFKLLVVADGVGGMPHGGEASRYVAQMMVRWFEKISPDYYGDTEKLIRAFNQKLFDINKGLCSFKDGRATTFVGSIVGNNKTIIASLGDSRAYIAKNGELKQISRDDSLVQEYFEEGTIRTKDDTRFHKNANRITRCLGVEDYIQPFRPNIYVLDNSQYDKLLLVSDGISDCLSDNQIMAITTKTPREEIAKKLVETASETESKRKEAYNQYNFNEIIEAGMDNMTAAVYSKK